MIAAKPTAYLNTWPKTSDFGAMMANTPAQPNFILPAQLPAKITLLSTPSGLPTTLAMQHDLQARHYQGDVVFMHMCPNPETLEFAQELQDAADQFAELSLLVHYEELAGEFSPATLHYAVPDWAQRSTWVCGSEQMTDALARHWQAKAIPVPLQCAQPAAAPIQAAQVLHA